MKTRRHAKILELIQERPIDTQEELLKWLRNEKFDVTQATVSRDIKELKLIKVPSKKGGYKYSTEHKNKSEQEERFHKLFAGAVLSLQAANNLIVIKTIQGSANTVAVVVDSMTDDRIIGCVAGDDTVLVVTADNQSVKGVMNQFKKLMN